MHSNTDTHFKFAPSLVSTRKNEFKKPISIQVMYISVMHRNKSIIISGLFLNFSAPFTIQRLCELLTDPKKHYKRTDKFLRGIEKVSKRIINGKYLPGIEKVCDLEYRIIPINRPGRLEN
jgi:hypothetical protein